MVKGLQMDECENPNTSLASELGRFIRYATTAIGGYMVAQGYMTEATAELLAGITVAATPMLIGMVIAKMQKEHVAKVVRSLKIQQQFKGDSEPPKGD